MRLGPAARPAVDLALETLAAHGLLVEGPDAAPDVRVTAHAVASAYDLAPSVAAGRLRGAVVGVVGSSALGFEIARLLRLAGVGEVRRVRWLRPGENDIVVVAPAAYEAGKLAAWNRAALVAGTRWLLVRAYDGRCASVGPLVVPGESCCYQCLLLRRAANAEWGDDMAMVEEAPLAACADPGFDALVVALAAHLAIRWVAGGDTSLPGVLFAVEERPLPRIGQHAVVRVPRCPACSPVERVRSAPPLARGGGVSTSFTDQLVPALRRAVSPYTGIVRSLEECLHSASEPPLFRFACEVSRSGWILGSSLDHVSGLVEPRCRVARRLQRPSVRPLSATRRPTSRTIGSSSPPLASSERLRLRPSGLPSSRRASTQRAASRSGRSPRTPGSPGSRAARSPAASLRGCRPSSCSSAMLPRIPLCESATRRAVARRAPPIATRPWFVACASCSSGTRS